MLSCMINVNLSANLVLEGLVTVFPLPVFFFFLYSYLVQKLLPHSQKWFYLALFPQEVRVKKVVV